MTAVEFLVEKLKSQGLLIGEPNNLVAVRQAKKMEIEQQGYSEEEVLNIIDNYNETFKVDLILREDFNQWFEQFKNK
jgi:predicted sugar kinase